MPDSEAVRRWKRANTYNLTLTFNHHVDADILARLETVDSKAKYIRDAIREKMERERQK